MKDGPSHLKPANLLYGVDDTPPRMVSVLLALQHVSVISVGWVFVVVLVTSIGGTHNQAADVIRMSMIASGVATILQARTQGPVGSGFLCPFSCGPAYLAASILAGRAAGLPAIFGLTLVSGLFEGAFSRLVRRLRALFPPEVTGLIVAMVGIELISLGCTRFLGYAGPGLPMDGRSVLVAVVTLSAMVAPTVWSSGKARLYPIVIGLVVGYALAFATGIFTTAQLHGLLDGPLLSLPHRVPGGLTFHPAYLIPFLIASLSSSLKTVGDLTLCQKINDAHWKQTLFQPEGRASVPLLPRWTGGAGPAPNRSHMAGDSGCGRPGRLRRLSLGLPSGPQPRSACSAPLVLTHHQAQNPSDGHEGDSQIEHHQTQKDFHGWRELLIPLLHACHGFLLGRFFGRSDWKDDDCAVPIRKP